MFRREEREAVAAASLVPCPAYFNVSAPKAELLNKIKDLPEEAGGVEEQADINQKKVSSKHPLNKQDPDGGSQGSAAQAWLKNSTYEYKSLVLMMMTTDLNVEAQ